MTIRPKLLEILQHSLGLDQHGLYKGKRLGYRNHFSSGPSCDHYVLCRELVEAGCMVEHSPKPGLYPYSTFVVTDHGRAVVASESPAPPKLSRSKQRYQRWLEADSSLSFGEWIRTGYSR